MEEYGNVTFAEAAKLLIDIIGEDVIRGDCRAVYQKIDGAEPESLQWYASQFFEETIEKKYALPRLVMKIVDSFTWQFFSAHSCITPFEKPRKETAIFLIKKELFNLVNNLVNGSRMNDGNVYYLSANSIISFLDDSVEKIKSEINKEFKKNKLNWRNDLNWSTLEVILDFLVKNGKTSLAHRLIKLYFFKNTQKALEKILHISVKEQKTIINDIKKMIIKNRKPEKFYSEKDLVFHEKIELINMCQAYHYHEKFDIKNSDEIIKFMESKCQRSKVFFSPWLRARAKVIETGEKLIADKEAQEQIIEGYKKAYKEGINFAGVYLWQFFLEGVTVNKFTANDLFDYEIAMDIFGIEKQNMSALIKDNTNLVEQFSNFQHSTENPVRRFVRSFYPDLQSLFDSKDGANYIINMGLSFEKTGDCQTALEYFKASVILNPANIDAYFCRANAYNKMGGRYSENTLSDFNIALLLEPEHKNALINRGIFFLENRQFENAIKDFSKLIEINPSEPEAFQQRGDCFARINDLVSALKDYSKAIELNPNYAQAYFSRGLAYKLFGANDKAYEDFSIAMQIDPEFISKQMHSLSKE